MPSSLKPDSFIYPIRRPRFFQNPPTENVITNGVIAGIPPGILILFINNCFLLESVCSSDTSCAGYPLAFCDGVCKCREEALNAGSACIPNTESGNNGGSCPAGQTYVSEIGVCLAGIRLLC